MAGSKKPRGIRHDRHCYRCRMNGIKCDLNRPRCQPCLQQDVSCQYPQRVKWMSEKTNPVQAPKSSPRVSPSSPSSNTTSSISTTINNHHDQTDLHANIPINLYGFIDLLSHFYQEIQSSKQELPNEAIELISRTLSFARFRLQGTDDKDSIQSHLTVLSNLSRVIQSAHPVALFGIGTFAMFEVCCGSFGQWHRHLQGARSLLDLVWFDVTGTLVRGDGALIFDDWHRKCLHRGFFESVGCPPDTFNLFVHIVDLSTRAMDQILHLNSTDTSDSSLAASLYRYAGAIGAFAQINRSQHDTRTNKYSHSSVLSDMVDRACNAISNLPTTSRFYVHLATPAHLIGQYATHSRQCEVIRTYWRNCRLCEFPRYPDGQEQCERHWVDRGIISGGDDNIAG